MIDPLFWLGLSILLVAVSLTAVLMAALPALRELSRAARSAEKLFDTLSRELPPTLEAIRLTGIEISDLTDDVSEGVQSAGRVVQQVDQSISGVKKQAKQAQTTTRSIVAGVKAAWTVLSRSPAARRSPDRLSASSRSAVEFDDDLTGRNIPLQHRTDLWQEHRDDYRDDYLNDYRDDDPDPADVASSSYSDPTRND